MYETLLHVGNGHPNLVWALVPSFVTFVLGLGIGLSADRIRELTSRTETPTTE